MNRESDLYDIELCKSPEREEAICKARLAISARLNLLDTRAREVYRSFAFLDEDRAYDVLDEMITTENLMDTLKWIKRNAPVPVSSLRRVRYSISSESQSNIPDDKWIARFKQKCIERLVHFDESLVNFGDDLMGKESDPEKLSSGCRRVHPKDQFFKFEAEERPRHEQEGKTKGKELMN